MSRSKVIKALRAEVGRLLQRQARYAEHLSQEDISDLRIKIYTKQYRKIEIEIQDTKLSIKSLLIEEIK